MHKIVLDTNCLIASLSKRGEYFQVWKDLHAEDSCLDDVAKKVYTRDIFKRD